MSAADKIQCPVRLYEHDYEKIRTLATEEGLSYQKVAEFLLLQYVKGNKEVTALVKKYAEERKAKNGNKFDDSEKSNIFDQIMEVSPIKHFDEGR
jgi:hypothetical protein